MEFTAEDEETLVMFASQAALVIANARRHREEQRARADLETLVNTAPVGVLVFDAKTGGVTSVNREARRIVSELCPPGGSAEQLLDMLTFRRADGREVSLEEFPLAQALSTGETVRAEEIVLQAPGGGSVTTLVNATPIRSEEGEVESVVVTLQDMTPLEDLERLRAEFLGMVSHELRTPLSAIKGSAATLTEAASDLDPAEMLQFFRIIGEQADHMQGPDRRPARRGAHRDGRAVGGPRACGCGDPGGRGQEQVPERRRPEQPPHRPLTAAAAGHGGRADASSRC